MIYMVLSSSIVLFDYALYLFAHFACQYISILSVSRIISHFLRNFTLKTQENKTPESCSEVKEKEE